MYFPTFFALFACRAGYFSMRVLLRLNKQPFNLHDGPQIPRDCELPASPLAKPEMN